MAVLKNLMGWQVLWQVLLWAITITSPAWAETAAETRNIETGNLPINLPMGIEQQPATTVEEWVAQIEASLVRITDVRVEVTEAGLQIVLETADSSLAIPETRVVGNALIADIPKAAIAEPFEQADPIAGIALVEVTGLPGVGEASPTENRVRVAITGTDAPPVAEVTAETQGLVLVVTLGDADAAAEEDEIEVVVTGEQEEGYRVPDTSVGTRTDTPLRDIPQSIQIVPQEVLRDQNVSNITEALRNVPGVSQSFTSRETGSEFAIRGFLVDSRQGSNFLRNGLRETGESSSVLTPNIERIEVLKGPASVLYGRGLPGGTINIVTEQPLSDPFYAVDATIGSYDFYEGAIDLSGPLNDSETVLYRLNAAYLDRGSFVDFYNLRQFVVAPVVSVTLGERTRFTLEGEYTDQSLVADPNLPAVGTVLPNPNGEIPRERNINEPDGSFDGAFSRVGYRLEHQFSDNWSIQQAFQWRTINRSSDRYAFADSLDADNRTLNRVAARLSNNFDVYDLNVNLTGRFATGSIGHQLVFGVDLGRLERSFDFSTGTAAPLDLFNPVYGQPFGELARVSNTDFSQDTLGIYLQDQVTLAENLKLLLGGRFDLFEQTNQDFLGDTESSQSGDGFTPRVGIVYQPIEPISLYASYSRSFNPLEGTSFEGDLFQPERGTQYEVGVKADLNDRLTATLALYELTLSNVLTADTRPGVPPGEFDIQGGEQRSRGVELSIAGEILPGWNIIAGYAYTDARVTEDNVIPVGARLERVPENAFNVWTSYEFQRGSLQGLGLGVGFFFVGERGVITPSEFELPSYLRTDAAIYYQRDQFRAALNFRNLFDVDYFETAFYDLSVAYGDPFTVQGTISWEF